MKGVVLFLIVMNVFDQTVIEETQLFSYNINTLNTLYFLRALK